MLTEEKLKKIFPNVTSAKCALYTKAFNEVLPKYNIDTPKRLAAFLGQIAVESGELKFDKELPSKYNKKDVKDTKEPIGTLYEGRKTLGNIQPGDGPKFIGRGILQLTGRFNYERMSKTLNIDLVNNPDLACDPFVSTQIAAEYFKSRNINSFSDVWNLDKVTELVNGRGKLHHDLRVKYSERALKILTE